MTPQTALAAQIEGYRKMTGEQRWDIAFELHELACDMARAGIHHQHPNAGEAEVNRLLRTRLALVRKP